MKFTKTFSRSVGGGPIPPLGGDIVPVLPTAVDLDNGAYLRFGHDDTEISHSFAIICVAPAGSPPVPCDLYFYDELTTAWYICDTENLTPSLLDWMDVAMLQPQPVAIPGAPIGADLAIGAYYVRPRMTPAVVYPPGTYMFAFGLDAQAAMSDIDAAIILIANATHLEDTPHITGDRGMFDLAVRNDLAQTVLTDTNGDYSGFAVNDRGETLSRDVDIIVPGVALVAPGDNVAITCTSGINTVGVLATRNTTVEAVFEGTRDGAVWEAVYGIDRISNLRVLGFGAGIEGSWAIPSAGYQQIRVRATTIGAAPTVTVALEGSAKPIILMPTPTADTSATGVITVAMGAGSVAVDTNGASTCCIRVTGPIIGWGGADVTFERFDPDLALWEQAIGYPPDGGLGALTATGDGVWIVPCAGFSQVRGRAAGVGGAAGPLTISLESSTGVQLVTQLNDHRTTGVIANPGAGSVTVNTNGYSTCMIQVTAAGGWGTAIVYFERYDPDLATWAAAVGYPPEGGLGLPSVTANGVWIVPCAGFSQVRARAAAVNTSDITLSLESSPGIQIATPPGDHRTTQTFVPPAIGNTAVNTNGYSTCTIQATCANWGTGVVTFERYDPDLATWAAAIGYPPDGGLGLPSVTANGIWIVPCAGFSQVRALLTGLPVVDMTLSLESSPGIQMVTQLNDHRTTNTFITGAPGDVEVNTNGYSTCTIQATCAGWGTAILYFQRYDPDLATWATAFGYPPDGGLGLPSTTADGVWIVPCAGFSRVRARLLGITTQPTTLSLESSPGIQTLSLLGDHVATGAVAAGAGSVIVNTNGYSTCTIQTVVSGGLWGTAEVFFERFDPNLATWEATLAYPPAGGVGVISTVADGVWIVPCAGFSLVRARAATVNLGTITMSLEASPGVQMVFQPSQFLRTYGYEFPALNQDANATYNVAPTVTDHNYGTSRGDGTAVLLGLTTITLTTGFTLVSSQIRKVIVVTAAGTEVRVLENGKNGVRMTLTAPPGPYTLTIAGAGPSPIPAGCTVEVLWDGPDKAVVAEDVAAVSGEYINKLGAVRRDVPVSSAGSDGDWATINEDQDGYLYERSKSYDAAANADRVGEIAPIWSRNVQTPVTIAAALTVTGTGTTWQDIGTSVEIGTQGYKTIFLWLVVAMGTTTNLRVRAMFKHTAADTDEYTGVIGAADVSGTPYNIKFEQEYLEYDVDADQKVALPFDVENGIPYVQFQVLGEVLGVTPAVITSAKVTYGY